MKKSFIFLFVFIVSWHGTLLLADDESTKTAAAADTLAVHIRVDASKPIGELKPIWRFFGEDEPNYAYLKDGKTLIGELGELDPKNVYFRAHNLLCTGDGTPALKWGSTNAYREDADGKPIYDWTIVDRIFDTYLERGVRPYAQIGFMPESLSTKPDSFPINIIGIRRKTTTTSTPAGLIRPTITASGPNWFTSGPSIASTNTAPTK